MGTKQADSIEIVLDRPIEAKGVEVDKITLSRPKMKHIRDMSKIGGTDLDQEFWLVSTLTGLPVRDFEEMDADQYKHIQTALGKYM